jgi:GMP synthase (glutamine-hydrolysing)
LAENQAFSLGSQVLALQFHIEADPRAIERWLIGHTCELTAVKADLSALRDQAQTIGTRVAEAGTRVLDLWLAELTTRQ